MRDYKMFYPAESMQGKWHTGDPILGVADCSPVVLNRSIAPIHRRPDQSDRPHPMLCKRCLSKK